MFERTIGDVRKSLFNPYFNLYFKAPADPNTGRPIDFVKIQDIKNEPSWEEPDVPKSANPFRHPDGTVDVYVNQHILVSDGNESFSSPLGLGSYTTLFTMIVSALF